MINGAPDPVTIAQVLVDDAYWQFNIEPHDTLARLEQAGDQVGVGELAAVGLEPVLVELEDLLVAQRVAQQPPRRTLWSPNQGSE